MWDRPDSAHAGPPHRQHCRHKGTRSGRKPHWRPGGTCQFPEWVTSVDRASRGRERIPAAHYLALIVPHDRQNKVKIMKQESFFGVAVWAYSAQHRIDGVQDAKEP